MRAARRGLRASLVLLGLLLPYPAAAAPDHLRYYRTGLSAAESGDWALVEKMMRRAVEEAPEETRLLLRRGSYFPHFYLGLARYHLGDCQGALASWAESENQGAIVGRDEYLELLRLQDDCQEHGKPSLAGEPTGQETEEEKKTGKEKVRTGQRWVEKSADPARKTLSAVEDVAPEGSDLARAAHQGQEAVDLAETATDLVDLALPPSRELEAAIGSYFAGDPQRTLELLQGLDLGDPRARAQVYLFRSAAHFRLHVHAGRDEKHLAAARENARLFNREQWRGDFPAELFDPRFVAFVRGAG